MDFKIGDPVKYTFPAPLKDEKRTIAGFVDYISESFIYIRCMDNSFMRISYKNFEFLELQTNQNN